MVSGVSDVDDARSIDLLPSDTHLTLFEREVSKSDREVWLRRTVGALLTEARTLYDLVLIDSAPGLSVLTESWLREADFYLSPTRPDYISTRGLKFLAEFRQRDASHGLCRVPRRRHQHEGRARARGCGIRGVAAQGRTSTAASAKPSMRVAALQSATRFAAPARSYWAKYPGQTGESLRLLDDRVVGSARPGGGGLSLTTSSRVVQRVSRSSSFPSSALISSGGASSGPSTTALRSLAAMMERWGCSRIHWPCWRLYTAISSLPGVGACPRIWGVVCGECTGSGWSSRRPDIYRIG